MCIFKLSKFNLHLKGYTIIDKGYIIHMFLISNFLE